MKKLTLFQKKVYTVVRKIPRGKTRPYKWVAEKIGEPSAVRAVGSALSHNPFPLIVPCHRVIGSDGSIGGYAWGKGLKRKILRLEEINAGYRSKKERAKYKTKTRRLIRS